MTRASPLADASGAARQLALDFSAPTQPPPWRVRESARARRLSARVFRDGRVEIVVPLRSRARSVEQFVAESRGWIEAAVARALARPAPVRLVSDEFPPRCLQLPAVRESWPVVEELAGRAVAPETLRAQLRLRLRQRAAAAVWPQLQALAVQMSVTVTGLQIRLQRSRWGSCSRHGRISLNACLLFQPPEVLRYLLVHELAHRRHMNHGPAFWELVARHEPQWRALDRELARGFQRVPRWIFHGLAADRAR